MGYELSIKREDGSRTISKKEWIQYIELDLEFEPIEEFSIELDDAKTLTVSTPNAGLWKSDKGAVPFTFNEKYGEITVKNPEIWIIEKMLLIANKLNAVVEGEEGERYDEKYLKKHFSDSSSNSSSIVEKKWWQFWK